MIKKLVLALVLASNLAFLSNAIAGENPVEMLTGVTDAIIKNLNKNKVAIKKDSKLIYSFVNKIVVPHADFEEMAQWVAGRNAWTKASLEERKLFITEFKKLVVNTYGNALASFRDQKVKYLPLRGDISTKERVIVSSVIDGNNNDSIKVDYKLVNRNGDWLVYDIVIEGVSLIKGYQAQFSDNIRQNGLGPTIIKMREYNAQS